MEPEKFLYQGACVNKINYELARESESARESARERDNERDSERDSERDRERELNALWMM